MLWRKTSNLWLQKKIKVLMKKSLKKNISTTKKNSKTLLASKKTNKKKTNINVSTFIRNITTSLQKTLNKFIFLILSSLRNLIRAPFLFINVFTSGIIFILNKCIFYFFSFLKNLLTNIARFKEVFFGIIFGILSGGLGAILAISYIEISSDETKKNVKLWKPEQNICKLEKIENDVANAIKNSNENKDAVNNIKLTQEKLLDQKEDILLWKK